MPLDENGDPILDENGNPVPDAPVDPVTPPDAPVDPVDPPVDPVDPPAPVGRTLGQDAEEIQTAEEAAKATAEAVTTYKAEVAAKLADLEAAAELAAEEFAREKSEFAADLKAVGKTLVTKLPDGTFLLRYLVPGSETITSEIGVGPETVVPE